MQVVSSRPRPACVTRQTVAQRPQSMHLVGVDDEHLVDLVDAVDRADVHAREVLDAQHQPMT